jgi:methionyl-tRNA synthetase
MDISRLNQAQYIQAFNILCAAMPSLRSRQGLYPTFCRVPKHGKTLRHSHFEPEVFYVISGSGEMMIDQESSPVSAGDLVRIPPFAEHELSNTGTNDLVFLSVYSEDYEVPAVPPRAIITAAPPTPNGPLHLGHMSGPYLATDILRRYLRMRSVSATSHCGTDDHQNYVEERARAQGEPSEAFRQKMRNRILTGLRAFDADFDEWIEPRTDLTYQERIQRFVQKAIQAGAISLENLSLPYCEPCDIYLIDALIDGFCPVCEEPSRGGCENCGIVVPPQSISHPKCSRCGHPPQMRNTTAYTFALDNYLPSILPALENLRLPIRVRKMIQRASQIRDLKILLTYPAAPTPESYSRNGLIVPGLQQQIHVWFEMAAHYERFSHGSETWIHCFGFDNAFHYLLFIPALLKALNPGAKLPDHVITNEFLTLDGLKFSTSRNHAIWADEVDGDIELLRFYLGFSRPDPMPSDFSVREYKTFARFFKNELSYLRERAFHLGQNAGRLSDDSESPSPDAVILCNRLTRDMELQYSPEKFNLREASRALLRSIDTFRQWKNSGRSEYLMLQAWATCAAPLLPRLSQSLLQSLNRAHSDWITDWASV